MTKQEKVAANELAQFMINKEIDKQQVAEYTHSGVRAVERWLHTGIPVLKWELLQLKCR